MCPKLPTQWARVALASLAVLVIVVTGGCCTRRGGKATAPVPPAAVQQSVTAVPAPRPEPAAAERPKTKEACGACNGVWAIHGLGETEACNCRTKDGGKLCRDGAECEASCIADENRFEVVQAGPPAKGFYVGNCSEFETAFGCFKFIAAGIRAKGPQLKEDAADSFCID
jgi:hypothetical protein